MSLRRDFEGMQQKTTSIDQDIITSYRNYQIENQNNDNVESNLDMLQNSRYNQYFDQLQQQEIQQKQKQYFEQKNLQNEQEARSSQKQKSVNLTQQEQYKSVQVKNKQIIQKQQSKKFVNDIESILLTNKRVIHNRNIIQNSNAVLWTKLDMNKIGNVIGVDLSKVSDLPSINKYLEKNMEVNQITNINYNTVTKILNQIFDNPTIWQSMRPENLIFDKLSQIYIELNKSLIRVKKSINNRSLATQVVSQFKLKGESKIAFFLRTNIKRSNEESVLLQLYKDNQIFDQKLILTFGNLDTGQQIYQTVKKIDFPITKLSEEFLQKNLVDVQMIINDYGKDRIDVKLIINKDNQNEIHQKFENLAIPFFEDQYLQIGAIGESIQLTKLLVEQADQNQLLSQNIQQANQTCRCNIYQGISVKTEFTKSIFIYIIYIVYGLHIILQLKLFILKNELHFNIQYFSSF